MDVHCSGSAFRCIDTALMWCAMSVVMRDAMSGGYVTLRLLGMLSIDLLSIWSEVSVCVAADSVHAAAVTSAADSVRSTAGSPPRGCRR